MKATPAKVGFKLRSAGRTDVGRQREHNEDSMALDASQGLFVVADGMGGHQAGDVASKLATQIISEFFEPIDREATWPSTFSRHLSEEENRTIAAVQGANRRIFEESRRNRSLSGMGTTVVMALFSEKAGNVVVGHVGDSRAYRIRDGEIHQLTRDHSLMNEPFPNMSEAERAELPRNVITRALGMDGMVKVDISKEDIQAGDTYLLCSDGLSSMLTDEEILDVVVSLPDVEKASEALIQSANEHGGEDNVTAILVRVEKTISLEDASTVELGPETMRKLREG